MSSKQKHVDKPNISPVLFMDVEGEPMSFFMRPGPVKRQLQPFITAGGGLLCNVQQPGAILLIDPEERSSFPESAAHWYISTQYISDCVEKDEQLNLEDYRLNPEVSQRKSARLNNSTSGLSVGRISYTAEEDAAILSYVSNHKTEVGGNRLWQEMEKQHVTTHSWQSMKDRYRARLAKKQTEVVETETTEKEAEAADGEIKVEGNQETEVENSSSADDAASPQKPSTESDLTQIDAQSVPSQSKTPETSEAQTSICPQEEVQHVNPQTDEQPAENSQLEIVEAETCNSPQPEESRSDPPADAQPIPAESTETAEPQTSVPEVPEVPEDSPPAQPKSPPDTSAQKKLEEKQKASPRLEQQQRRLTRKQLQLEEPEPYGKKLRSSLSSVEQLTSSPQPLRKTKSQSHRKDSTVDQPPSKKAKVKSAAAVEEVEEIPQEENERATASETTQADTESVSVPQNGEKKKEERRLGILEMATKEFEDESESDEDEAPALKNTTETALMQPAPTEAPLPTPDTAASSQSNPEPRADLQEDEEETETSTSDCLPPSGRPEPSDNKPSLLNGTSTAHLFIFDRESQEEESQSIIGEILAAPANPQSTVDIDAAFSLTQVQLEEDKQRIRELMKETNQDLATVTKALLKTSGEFSAAMDLLLNPNSLSGPFWTRSDDRLLLSGDRVNRQRLQEKYSEEGLAKRIVFLEFEG